MRIRTVAAIVGFLSLLAYFGHVADLSAQQGGYMSYPRPVAGGSLKFYPVTVLDAGATSPATWIDEGSCSWDTVHDCLACSMGSNGPIGYLCPHGSAIDGGAGDGAVSLTGPDGGVAYISDQNKLKAEAGFNYNETDNRLRINSALTATTFGGNLALDLQAAASGRALTLQLGDGTNQSAVVSYLNGGTAPRLGLGGAAETLSFILSSGNVGLGTTGPNTHVEVVGATPDTSTVRIRNSLVAPTGNNGNSVLGLYNTVNNWAINGDTGGSLLINDDSLASITRLSVAPTTGNVAIGGSLAGSYTLHVAKAVASDWLTAVENTDTGAGDVYIGHGTGEGMAVVAGTDLSTVGASYAFKVDRAAASYLYVHANGSLGIGTASPTTLIHALKAQNAPTVATIDNTTSGTSAFASYTVAASAAHAYLYAFSAGYTTSGAYMADGVTLEAGTDASAGLNLIANASAPIRFYTAGANLRGQWDASGNLNVANLTPSLPVCTDGSSNLISCSSTITGSGTAGQVTYWSGTSAITGNANFTFSTGGVINSLTVGDTSGTPTQLQQYIPSSSNADYSTSATSQGYAITYDSGVNSIYPNHRFLNNTQETGRHIWTEYNFADSGGTPVPSAGWFAVSGTPAGSYVNGSSIRFYTANWDGVSALARYERFAVSDSGTTTRGTVEITPANSAFSTAAITTTATTFSFLNGGATSVNIAQTATTLSIGAVTGTTTVNNTLNVQSLGASLPVCTDGSKNLTTSGCSSGSTAFSGITSGTNTTAAMIVGTGASLNFTGAGTINASSLLGATWASPAAIGSTTPAAGTFTSLTATGLFTASAGQRVARTTTATSYSVVSTDYYVGVTSTAAPRTITLEAAATACTGGPSRVIVVKDESGGAKFNTITIDASGAETIDGAASYTLNRNYEAVTLVSDCVSAWFVI